MALVPLGGKKISIAEKGINTKYLPGKNRTESIIASRKPAIETFKEEINTPSRGFLGKALKPVVAGLKGINIPLERAESAISAPLLKLQEITQPGTGFISTPEMEIRKREGFLPTEEQLSEQRNKRFNFIKDTGKDILKGVKGERITEFGDVPRRAGFPEPLSAAIGFGTAIGALDPALGKPVNKSVKKITDFFKGTIPKKAPTDFTLKKATQLYEGLEGVRDSLGKAIRKGFSGKSGQKLVDAKPIQDAFSKIDNSILKRMRRPEYNIQFNANGTVKQTAENVWQMRKFFDDMLTSKDYVEATKLGKQAIKNARNSLRKSISETVPEVSALMKRYSSFMDKYEPIIDIITDKRGNIVEKGLRNIFKSGLPERSKQKFFLDVAELFPDALKIVEDVVRFNRSQILNKGLKTAGKSLVGLSLLRKALSGIGGDDTTVQTVDNR